MSNVLIIEIISREKNQQPSRLLWESKISLIDLVVLTPTSILWCQQKLRANRHSNSEFLLNNNEFDSISNVEYFGIISIIL